MPRTSRRRRLRAAGRRSSRSLEHAVALLVHDLLSLRDRELGGAFAAGMGFRADEAVLLHALGEVLLDDAGGLEPAGRGIRGRPDAVTLIFYGLHGCFARFGRGSAEETRR